MDLWQCSCCSYMYDPEMGDPENDIEAGVFFEDLPSRWVCPECGAKKSQFKPYNEESEEFEEEEEQDN